MLSEEQYWEVIQSRVCEKCLDGDGKGGCVIAHSTECALKKYFPQIIEVINSTYSSSMQPYVEQLRSKICGICVHQSEAGRCSVRNEVECALDRYFPLVVQAIEEAQFKERVTKTGQRETS